MIYEETKYLSCILILLSFLTTFWMPRFGHGFGNTITGIYRYTGNTKEDDTLTEHYRNDAGQQIDISYSERFDRNILIQYAEYDPFRLVYNIDQRITSPLPNQALYDDAFPYVLHPLQASDSSSGFYYLYLLPMLFITLIAVISRRILNKHKRLDRPSIFAVWAITLVLLDILISSRIIDLIVATI